MISCNERVSLLEDVFGEIGLSLPELASDLLQNVIKDRLPWPCILYRLGVVFHD